MRVHGRMNPHEIALCLLWAGDATFDLCVKLCLTARILGLREYGSGVNGGSLFYLVIG